MGSKSSEATHCPQPKELRKKCSCEKKEGIGKAIEELGVGQYKI